MSCDQGYKERQQITREDYETQMRFCIPSFCSALKAKTNVSLKAQPIRISVYLILWVTNAEQEIDFAAKNRPHPEQADHEKHSAQILR